MLIQPILGYIFRNRRKLIRDTRPPLTEWRRNATAIRESRR